MRISFKQKNVTGDQLKIDLTSLRRTERYAERKLELMQEYVMLSQEERTLYFNRYFFGETPLFEPFEMRSDLTQQQQEIVALEGGYHLVEGPAGSGKTAVLLEHIRYLAECKYVPVDHILVVTHLNGAIDRIGSDVAYLQRNNSTVKTTTLNALGEGIFRKYRQILLRGDDLPYYTENAELKLLTGRWDEIEAQELLLVGEVLADFQQGRWMHVPWPAGLDILQCDGVYGQTTDEEKKCLKAIHWLKEHGVFPTCPPDGERICSVLKTLPATKYTASFYYAVYVDYLFLLGERGIYTYNDQILFALAILRTHLEVARDYQRRYEHIIVDEFQDFTPAEAEVVRILSQEHQNVMVFGDDIQDIRPNKAKGIADSLLDDFEIISGDNLSMSHRLKINFRSVQEILNLANAVRDIGKNHYRLTRSEPQTAARGSRGEKPVAMCIDVQFSNSSTRKNSDDINDTLLHAMVDAALHEEALLPLCDKGSVALMVAKQPLSYRVQRYLKERKLRPFSVLGSTHRFQTRYIGPVLSYFRLIDDRSRDNDMEQILGRCFDTKRIRDLKKLAQIHEQLLVDIIMDGSILAESITQDQEAALRQHMNVLHKFSSESNFSVVWQAISELPDGPITAVAEQASEKEELEDILTELKNYTVAQALKYIDSHISFVEEHRASRNLIVTTIDHAKSQAFDTVFLLGADLLKERKRWYVSVSRAKQRFFFLVDGRSPEGWLSNPVLVSIDDDLYNKR